MKGIIYIDPFISHPEELLDFLINKVSWDERMMARKTASYGVAYNYSQISYPYQNMPLILSEICSKINAALGFTPNNCLLNYYLDGNSTMGFHSDQTDILEENTGVAILSVGGTRILRFRRTGNKNEVKEYSLPAGSLIYMTQEVQNEWQHAIPKSEENNGRISLTFRRIKQDHALIS